MQQKKKENTEMKTQNLVREAYPLAVAMVARTGVLAILVAAARIANRREAVAAPLADEQR